MDICFFKYMQLSLSIFYLRSYFLFLFCRLRLTRIPVQYLIMHVRWRLQSRWSVQSFVTVYGSLLERIRLFLGWYINDAHVSLLLQLWASSRWKILFRGKVLASLYLLFSSHYFLIAYSFYLVSMTALLFFCSIHV